MGFNDLFIGAGTHVSARDSIRFSGGREQQSSSGIVVSTGAGSTGWLSSIFNQPAGAVLPEARWELASQMPAGGVIFSDGMEADYLEFNTGAMARVGIAPERANLVVA